MARTQWYPNYQPRDIDIVDYREFRLPGCDVPFRGPAIDPFTAPEGSFFTTLGAAQTYGCFYDNPYPTLLGRATGLDVLNLGVGGAGPGFYTQYESLIAAMNRGRFVVLQCMAARHESNSLVEADGYVEFVKDRRTGESRPGWDFWNHVLATDLDNVEKYVAETRRSWVETTRRLVAMINVPVIFFWFSRRRPDYRIDMDAIRARLARPPRDAVDQTFNEGLTGEFPHLVDGPTARAASALCDVYAECLSSRGMGAPLLNRFTGQPVGDVDNKALGAAFTQLAQTHNIYYPSAEMHEDACAALLPVARAILSGALGRKLGRAALPASVFPLSQLKH